MEENNGDRVKLRSSTSRHGKQEKLRYSNFQNRLDKEPNSPELLISVDIRQGS